MTSDMYIIIAMALAFIPTIASLVYLIVREKRETKRLVDFLMKSLDAKASIGIVDIPEKQLTKNEKKERGIQKVYDEVVATGVMDKGQREILGGLVKPLDEDDGGFG